MVIIITSDKGGDIAILDAVDNYKKLMDLSNDQNTDTPTSLKNINKNTKIFHKFSKK